VKRQSSPDIEEGWGWLVSAVTWISPLLVRLGYQGLLDPDIRLDPHHGEYNLLACSLRLGRRSWSSVTPRAPVSLWLPTST
jgi:predicted ATP-grasp superfamily ATP-dependent carboligase